MKRKGSSILATWLCTMLVGSMFFPSMGWGAGPLVVISITGGTAQTICDTDDALECITVTEGDLIKCNPISFGGSGEITGCDWSILFDGDDSAVDDDEEVNQQMRALEIAPNGALVFVVANTDTIPGGFDLKNNDVTVFSPTDVLQPYVGGAPYATTGGVFKTYLNGELTQQDPAAKPWDALELLPGAMCQDAISAIDTADHTCTVLGSLTGGSGTGGVFGSIEFANEDIIRCSPTGFATNGAVEGCDYAVMLDASAINGGGASGITSDIEAIDFLSLNTATMAGEMVFQKKTGNPTGFPPHEAGRDLLLYTGSFGSGTCSVTTATLCAGDSDCPPLETCNTGSCSTTPLVKCGTDQDCSGAGNVCNHTRPYVGTVTLFFDGSAVGLAGNGQKIEGFSIVPDDDGDGIPSGVDNCPNLANPPDLCSGGVASCPTGLSSECPSGEICTQADSDGDGVGDPCDQCNGRDDAVCFCGDAILDVPSEECDLGTANNGQPGKPCTAACQTIGQCTTAGTPCDDVSDCPPGEGCCGDGVETNPAEQCDDANGIDDDLCTNQCIDNPSGVPVVGCEDVTGPHLLQAFLKITKFKDTNDQPDIDRWKTKGDANFDQTSGLTIDPDSEPVTIIYNNNVSGTLFTSTLPAANFIQSGTLTKPKWKFLDKEANVPGAPSWRKGKFTLRANKLKFVLDGRKVTLFTGAELGPSPFTTRQSIRVGDVCITGVVTCQQKSGGKVYKCSTAP